MTSQLWLIPFKKGKLRQCWISLMFSRPTEELSAFFKVKERSWMSALAISASKQQVWTSLKGAWHVLLFSLLKFEKNWNCRQGGRVQSTWQSETDLDLQDHERALVSGTLSCKETASILTGCSWFYHLYCYHFTCLFLLF